MSFAWYRVAWVHKTQVLACFSGSGGRHTSAQVVPEPSRVAPKTISRPWRLCCSSFTSICPSPRNVCCAGNSNNSLQDRMSHPTGKRIEYKAITCVVCAAWRLDSMALNSGCRRKREFWRPPWYHLCLKVVVKIQLEHLDITYPRGTGASTLFGHLQIWARHKSMLPMCG